MRDPRDALPGEMTEAEAAAHLGIPASLLHRQNPPIRCRRHRDADTVIDFYLPATIELFKIELAARKARRLAEKEAKK